MYDLTDDEKQVKTDYLRSVPVVAEISKNVYVYCRNNFQLEKYTL